MKQLVALPLVCSLVLAACGGAPKNFGANPTAPSAQATASNTAPSTAPVAAPAAAASSTAPSAPQASGNSNLPTPPASAEVIDQIQAQDDGWNSCSVCAQGTNDTTNFWMATHVSTPAMSGNSREFYVGGPQWTNALFWKTMPGHAGATHFLWDFWVYWDPTSMANIWTSEFDFWQSVGGVEFMVGSQCNYGNGHWDLWDQKDNKWMPSSVGCSRMTPAAWHHIQWYVERGSDSYTYDTLVVDGTVYNFNKTYQPSHENWQDAVGVQWQLDQSANGGDVHEWIDNVKLTMW